MQMDVEDFLHGSLAVRKKQVHAFAAHATLSNRCRETVSDAQEVGSALGIDVGQIGRVLIWNDEQVAGIDRLDIEKGGTLLIAIDDAGRQASIQDTTEDAIVHG